jgi:hypothetical protein
MLERRTVVLHTFDALSRGTPPYPPFVRGGKETGRTDSILPPYEGGIQGGSSHRPWGVRNAIVTRSKSHFAIPGGFVR